MNITTEDWNATQDLIKKLQQHVNELEEALQPFAENIPEDYKAPCHSGITTARKCGRCSRAYKAYLALSDTSPRQSPATGCA